MASRDGAGAPGECAMIFKKGDDLRQDQLCVQMISLMDHLLKKCVVRSIPNPQPGAGDDSSRKHARVGSTRKPKGQTAHTSSSSSSLNTTSAMNAGFLARSYQNHRWSLFTMMGGKVES